MVVVAEPLNAPPPVILIPPELAVRVPLPVNVIGAVMANVPPLVIDTVPRLYDEFSVTTPVPLVTKVRFCPLDRLLTDMELFTPFVIDVLTAVPKNMFPMLLAAAFRLMLPELEL